VRIEAPIVNAAMARSAGGALAGAVSTATPASFTGWRCGARRPSGRHLSVHADLDAGLARLPEVRDRDLYVMRPERLPISTAGR
jgi:hypothetical protein